MRYTDAEAIHMIKTFMDSNKYVTRNDLRKLTGMSTEKLERLSRDGSFKFPLIIPKGKCHLFKKTDSWRNFKLKGSPTKRSE